uniref:Uncharacterized protein n=1 Tax=Brassica oleracea TaxID=3712 RepID=A0A3P6AUL1_BRAOL|nr:unnamed protein product [Brassica oleracea]
MMTSRVRRCTLRRGGLRIWSRSTLSSSATQSPCGLRRLLRRRFLMTRMRMRRRTRKARSRR